MFMSTPWIHSPVSVRQQSSSVNKQHILFLSIDRKQMLMSFLWQDIMYHFRDLVYDELLPFNNHVACVMQWCTLATFTLTFSLTAENKVSKCWETVPRTVNHFRHFWLAWFSAVLSDSASTGVNSSKLCFTQRAVEKQLGLIPCSFLSPLIDFIMTHICLFKC